ncbi:MAG: NAD(P)/FAD-dependent oxidoreductase [Kofleriaceae bacterium]|nr:NAD(P)/FAD-dependent oxidoreductase [Kofleriaceae bacterium]
MSEKLYEAIIIGAGPAGVAVAARLAQHGRAANILVLDRYHFPREKPCGGALTGHMDPALAELGLKNRVAKAPCESALIRYGSFERHIAMGKEVEVIRRVDFDADLVKQAREMGVNVVEGEGLLSYRRESEYIVVTTTKGRELRALVLVGADGAASKVRKTLLANKKETPHRLFMCAMKVPMPEGHSRTMVYDFSLMDRGLRGYLWLFPAPDNSLNVGLMHYPAKGCNLSGRDLTEMLRQGLLPYGIELPAKGTRGWPVWGYHPRARISEERVLTVGDAAGIDGLTGEGIAVALEQAIVAGDAIDAAIRTGKYSFSGYRRQIRKAIVGQELSLDRWLARLIYGSKYWREWLALVLLDDEVIEMYARRVDGTEILAHQKFRLYKALWRHSFRFRRRRKELKAHIVGHLRP